MRQRNLLIGGVLCGWLLSSAGIAHANTKSSDQTEVSMDEFRQEIQRANHPTDAQNEARSLAGLSATPSRETPLLPNPTPELLPASLPGGTSSPFTLETPPTEENPPASNEEDEQE